MSSLTKGCLKKINTDEETLEKNKACLDSQNSEQILKSAENLLELCKELKSLWELMPGEKRLEVIKQLCSNPTLNGRSVEYSLRKPFEILKKLNKTSEFDKWCAPSHVG